MSFLIFACLIASICCNILNCSTASTSENLKITRKPLGTSTTKNYDNQTPRVPSLWSDLLLPRLSPSKTEELRKVTNENANSTIRKSKILGSLAFLAGLSVAGLTSPTSSVKTYAKPPSVSLNFDASRVSPHIAPIYGPYPYVSHPYIFATPFGLYPVLSPVNLQPVAGLQNDLQSLAQQEQILSLLGNKKPAVLLNNNDEYTEEAKKVENVKTSNAADEEAGEAAEFEDDRNAEEKILKAGTTCSDRNGLRKKQNNLSEYNLEGFKDSLMLDSLLKASKPKKHHHSNTTQTNSTNPENQSFIFPLTTNQNRTQNNETTTTITTTTPFYGYYTGYPQDIHHIDFTTETNEYKYHNYDSVNYNLPSYDKPGNFYSSDERYNYYFNPPPDSSATNEFPREQMPEYFPHDFNRYLYTPYNTPPIANNGFRPVA
ncbi:uncharacterized protein LOC143362753 [Halictus rubicundus]|uniref:uncharacterized protein LOC143362753 n=1 Tax=Halictus rubicundus TaxID=77578 RepID=UPI004036A99C